jgi:hypothetical protein
MDEKEFDTWLSKANLSKGVESEKKFKVKPPSMQECSVSSQTTKSKIVNLPLSLENNSTLTGTAAIFEEFGREFSIPCLHASAIPFDRSEKKFDLMSARNQFDFMKSVNAHQIEMLELEKEMRSVEKHG